MRVARPSRTSSSPVANGSSVPAWPTFGACRRRARGAPPRRRRATSCPRACRRAAPRPRAHHARSTSRRTAGPYSCGVRGKVGASAAQSARGSAWQDPSLTPRGQGLGGGVTLDAGPVLAGGPLAWTEDVAAAARPARRVTRRHSVGDAGSVLGRASAAERRPRPRRLDAAGSRSSGTPSASARAGRRQPRPSPTSGGRAGGSPAAADAPRARRAARARRALPRRAGPQEVEIGDAIVRAPRRGRRRPLLRPATARVEIVGARRRWASERRGRARAPARVGRELRDRRAMGRLARAAADLRRRRAHRRVAYRLRAPSHSGEDAFDVDEDGRIALIEPGKPCQAPGRFEPTYKLLLATRERRRFRRIGTTTAPTLGFAGGRLVVQLAGPGCGARARRARRPPHRAAPAHRLPVVADQPRGLRRPARRARRAAQRLLALSRAAGRRLHPAGLRALALVVV